MTIKIGEFLRTFANLATSLIERYEAQYKELDGAGKKARLDDAITNYVEGVIDNIGLNFIFKFVIRKILIENIPTITQIIYNLIKTKVEGITK